MDTASSSTAPPDESAQDGENALETPETSASPASAPASSASLNDASGDAKAAAAPPPKKKGLKAKLAKFNLYLLLFIFIIVVGTVIIGIGYFQSKKANSGSVKSQDLSESTLKQLANSDASVGDPKQVLNVQSNAVFAGKVLVRDTLEVAGGIQVGGTVTLEGVTVSGHSNLGDVQINQDLSVAGNTALQGAATIQKSLQVNGNGTFNGTLSTPQITTSSLQLNGNLVLTHHITAGGPTPSRTNGPALGSGGTASVNGSDTAGTITVNTGSGVVAGCFLTVTFATKFDAIPHVIVTPVGASAGGIAYYVNRTTTNFSLCDASAPPIGASFAFDYFVVD